MSHVPARISTTPAQCSWPNAISDAATKVRIMPTTVTWFGVRGTRPTADINASARRRTQASNRVVNMHLLSQLRCEYRSLARLLIHLDHLRRHCLPCVAAGLLMPVGAHPSSQVSITREDDQGSAQLGPALGTDGQAVSPRLEDRHVARHLGGGHREA